MATQIMKIEHVETVADANKLLAQECISQRFTTTLSSLIIGFVSIPVILSAIEKKLTLKAPVAKEYKYAIAGLSAVLISYLVGNYSQKKCESNIKKQLSERLII